MATCCWAVFAQAMERPSGHPETVRLKEFYLQSWARCTPALMVALALLYTSKSRELETLAGLQSDQLDPLRWWR